MLTLLIGIGISLLVLGLIALIIFIVRCIKKNNVPTKINQKYIDVEEKEPLIDENKNQQTVERRKRVEPLKRGTQTFDDMSVFMASKHYKRTQKGKQLQATLIDINEFEQFLSVVESKAKTEQLWEHDFVFRILSGVQKLISTR